VVMAKFNSCLELAPRALDCIAVIGSCERYPRE
jgi:hypothetical protein